MKLFRTEDAVGFQYGTILGLKENQAKPRVQIKALKPLRDGKYEVTGDVQFKVGEVIGLEEVPKGLLSKLTAMADEKPEEGKKKAK